MSYSSARQPADQLTVSAQCTCQEKQFRVTPHHKSGPGWLGSNSPSSSSSTLAGALRRGRRRKRFLSPLTDQPPVCPSSPAPLPACPSSHVLMSPSSCTTPLLCTPHSWAKRGWAGCILFFAIFRFLPGYYRMNCLEVTMYTACTYKLKRKPLFDGLGLGVLNI